MGFYLLRWFAGFYATIPTMNPLTDLTSLIILFPSSIHFEIKSQYPNIPDIHSIDHNFHILISHGFLPGICSFFKPYPQYWNPQTLAPENGPVSPRLLRALLDMVTWTGRWDAGNGSEFCPGDHRWCRFFSGWPLHSYYKK